METGKAECYGAQEFWKALKAEYHVWKVKPGGETLYFQDEVEGHFVNCFKKYYSIIKNEFMTEDTKDLDAHKQAAIFVVSALEAQAMRQQCNQDEVALGPYAVILNVALSFLVGRINDKLKDIREPIKKIDLPVALACDTPYFDIMRRILYYETPGVEKNGISYNMNYNIIEWSDRFFLLEYITLLQNKIDPILMKDRFWD